MNTTSPSCQHSSCIISACRGFRNGFYYGGRIRFLHSIIMTILFKAGTLKEQITNICELTFEHAKNLGLFVFFYKGLFCLLNNIRGKSSNIHAMISGSIVAYFIFRKKTNVNKQIIMYLLARVLLGSADKILKEKSLHNLNYYPLLAAFTWGIIMFLFEDDKRNLQGGLNETLQLLSKDCDSQMKNWTDLLPSELYKRFQRNSNNNNN